MKIVGASFNGIIPHGFTYHKLLEAIRLLGGHADQMCVGSQAQYDLQSWAMQKPQNLGLEWDTGRISKIMGITVITQPEQTVVWVTRTADVVKVECA